MNLVVDTNIIFSAILSPKGKIHDLLLNSCITQNRFQLHFFKNPILNGLC